MGCPRTSFGYTETMSEDFAKPKIYLRRAAKLIECDLITLLLIRNFHIAANPELMHVGSYYVTSPHIYYDALRHMRQFIAWKRPSLHAMYQNNSSVRLVKFSRLQNRKTGTICFNRYKFNRKLCNYVSSTIDFEYLLQSPYPSPK